MYCANLAWHTLIAESIWMCVGKLSFSGLLLHIYDRYGERGEGGRGRERVRMQKQIKAPWEMESLIGHECLINTLRPPHLIWSIRYSANSLFGIYRHPQRIGEIWVTFYRETWMFSLRCSLDTANQLIPRSTALLEKKTAPQILKFSAIYGIRRFINAFKKNMVFVWPCIIDTII